MYRVCQNLKKNHSGAKRLKKICPSSFRDTCQWLKFPLNGLRAQSSVRPVVGLLTLAFGPACLGMVFPPLPVKQLYRCHCRHFFACENRVYHEKVGMTVG